MWLRQDTFPTTRKKTFDLISSPARNRTWKNLFISQLSNIHPIPLSHESYLIYKISFWKSHNKGFSIKLTWKISNPSLLMILIHFDTVELYVESISDVDELNVSLRHFHTHFGCIKDALKKQKSIQTQYWLKIETINDSLGEKTIDRDCDGRVAQSWVCGEDSCTLF